MNREDVKPGMRFHRLLPGRVPTGKVYKVAVVSGGIANCSKVRPGTGEALIGLSDLIDPDKFEPVAEPAKK